MNTTQPLRAIAAVIPIDKAATNQFKGETKNAKCPTFESAQDKSTSGVIYHPADLAALVGTTRADGCTYVEPWGDKEIAEFARLRGLEAYAVTRLESMQDLFEEFKQSLYKGQPDLVGKLSGFKMSENGGMKVVSASDTLDTLTMNMLNERLNAIPGLNRLMLEHLSVVAEWSNTHKSKFGEQGDFTPKNLASIIDYGVIFAEPDGKKAWSSSWKAQVYNSWVK